MNNQAIESETKTTMDEFPEEARRILHNLAKEWAAGDDSSREVIQLKSAMTNQVYQIKWPADGGGRRVILRIYGQGVDVFFDRETDVRTFECMSRNGQGPRLLGRFPNGRVEEFIHARTLSAPDLRDPEISSAIAVKLHEFHNLDMPVPKTPLLWQRLRNWMEKSTKICSAEEAREFQLEKIREEINVLEKHLSKIDTKLGFCHNDLQYGNIMIYEDTKQVIIIDYEFACFSPVAFDIAHHFCEMAANYHTQTPHIMDFNKYPDVEERRRFVETYLKSSGENPSSSGIEEFMEEIEKYSLVSHLFSGLWGIISEHLNNIDFEFVQYARQRFEQYWLMKQMILGS